ncbi:MAG TPA: PfkB family carbohydrate kinase [Candidatus Krumholzibacteria bacterium]|nr:PfkB family carbohydrate kinase [Candidatus Krumholzibacteria bacterium]
MTTASRPIVFGEVLCDRFPDGSTVLGGAPFNVAWNLQALGLEPLLVTRVGRDEAGERIADAMRSWGMDLSGLQRDPRRPTGIVEVDLADGEPRYSIAQGSAYDFIAADDLPTPASGDILCHGSLALRTPVPRPALERLQGLATGGTLVDVNLRAPWWDRGAVLDLLRRARWARLNAGELAALVPAEIDLGRRAARLLAAADLDCVIVTMGADGAVAHGRDGWVHRPALPSGGRSADTVGAGDAFTAVVLLGLVRGWDWPLILERAHQLASAVAGLRGATTADRAFYTAFRRTWEMS